MEDKIKTITYKFKINHFSNIWWSAVSDDKSISIGDTVLIVKDNVDFKKGTYAKVIDIEEKELTAKEILEHNRIVSLRH